MDLRRTVVALAAVNLLLGAALLAQLVSAAAASHPETVRARAIELVDSHGQVRAQLDVEASGEAVFRLRDAKGEIRVKLGAGADGSGLLLLDGTTEPGIHMLAKSDETSVTLKRRDGQRRVITP